MKSKNLKMSILALGLVMLSACNNNNAPPTPAVPKNNVQNRNNQNHQNDQANNPGNNNGGNGNQINNQKDPGKKADEKKLTAGTLVNNLMVGVLSQSQGSNPSNISYSTVGTRSLLQFAYAGADDATKKKMEALGISSNTTDLKDTVKPADPKTADVNFEVPSSIWSTNPESVLDAYKNSVNGLKVQELEKTALNYWVTATTRGGLKAFESKEPQVVMNTLYANLKFSKASTKSAPFNTTGAVKTDVVMMSKKDSFRYMEQDNAKWIVVPFADLTLNLVVLLPRTRFEAFDAVLKKITGDSGFFAESIQHLLKISPQTVDLALPKFSVNSSQSLNEGLSKLGSENLLANLHFTKMTKSGELTLQQMVQNTAVSFSADEAPVATTEAAPAATSGVKFEANEPFLYFIVNSSNEILLGGKMVKPDAVVSGVVSDEKGEVGLPEAVDDGSTEQSSPREDGLV